MPLAVGAATAPVLTILLVLMRGRRTSPVVRHPPAPPARTREGRKSTMESRDLFDVTRRNPMSNVQAIADRFEIEALRGEFTDAGGHLIARGSDAAFAVEALPVGVGWTYAHCGPRRAAAL
jgi:hypothetical protein